MTDKLSRDEILTMEAGAGLDLLIAKHIFDWSDFNHDTLTGWWYGSSPDMRANPQEPSGVVLKDRMPAFSTDIAAAWQVIEAVILNSNFDTFSIRSHDLLRRWGAGFWFYIWSTELREKEGDDVFIREANGNTAPLAICRAALLATLESET